MPWGFWRKNGVPAVREDAGRRERDGDDTEVESQVRARTRRRLIGAAALLLAAVFLVPMLLDPGPRVAPEPVLVTPSVETRSAPSVPATKSSEGASEAKPVEAVATEPQRQARTEAGSRADAAESSRPAASGAETFALQVAALSTSGAARDLAGRLKKAGFKSYVEPVDTAEGKRHRVRVGPFASREEALRIGEKLKAAGFSAAVVGA